MWELVLDRALCVQQPDHVASVLRLVSVSLFQVRDFRLFTHHIMMKKEGVNLES